MGPHRSLKGRGSDPAEPWVRPGQPLRGGRFATMRGHPTHDRGLYFRLAPNRQIETLLRTYPRVRPTLPPEYQRIYVDHYRQNRASSGGLTGVVAGLEGWMHRQVARAGSRGADILEVGGGTLNHVRYERAARSYDVVEPFRELWEDSPQRAAVRRIYQDIGEVPDTNRYDRILSVAVLEHLTNLPAVVARCASLLAEGGMFQAGVPTEGGMLWGAAWHSTTGVAFRLKRGLHYAPMMRHEHVNDAAEIEAVVGYLFADAEVRRFPLPWRHLSLYTYIEARAARLDRCRRLLQNACADRSA